MKGFKHTGRGPKMGHSFSPKAGFTHSGTNKQNVKGYTRGIPKVATKTKFATGGMVTAPMASGGSALTRRTKPVTGFDQEGGGKSPLRPGFNKGGKACYAEGGKVETVGAAIRMVKQLMSQGNSASDAAAKAARRYGVRADQLKAATPAGPTGGGGIPAEKQMLARGGLSKAAGAAVRNVSGPALPVGATRAGRVMPAPQSQKSAMTPARSNHGYGSFGRSPFVR